MLSITEYVNSVADQVYSTDRLYAWFLQESVSQDGVFVPWAYVTMTNNPIDAIILAQIVYWHKPRKNRPDEMKLRVLHDDNYWIAKSMPEWAEETHTPERTVRRALDRLEALGLIYREHHRSSLYNGGMVPYVRLNWDTFLYSMEMAVLDSEYAVEKVDDFQNKSSDSANVADTETANVADTIDSANVADTYTETTTENTTEYLDDHSGRPADPFLQQLGKLKAATVQNAGPAEDEGDKVTPDHPLAQLIMTASNSKSLTAPQWRRLNDGPREVLFFSSKNKRNETATVPSLVDLWDSDPSFVSYAERRVGYLIQKVGESGKRPSKTQLVDMLYEVGRQGSGWLNYQEEKLHRLVVPLAEREAPQKLVDGILDDMFSDL